MKTPKPTSMRLRIASWIASRATASVRRGENRGKSSVTAENIDRAT